MSKTQNITLEEINNHISQRIGHDISWKYDRNIMDILENLKSPLFNNWRREEIVEYASYNFCINSLQENIVHLYYKIKLHSPKLEAWFYNDVVKPYLAKKEINSKDTIKVIGTIANYMDAYRIKDGIIYTASYSHKKNTNWRKAVYVKSNIGNFIYEANPSKDNEYELVDKEIWCVNFLIKKIKNLRQLEEFYSKIETAIRTKEHKVTNKVWNRSEKIQSIIQSVTSDDNSNTLENKAFKAVFLQGGCKVGFDNEDVYKATLRNLKSVAIHNKPVIGMTREKEFTLFCVFEGTKETYILELAFLHWDWPEVANILIKDYGISKEVAFK